MTLILLMLLRYTTYRAINNHFFMLDFCYFMQISVITQTLLAPPTSSFGAAWFKANFALRYNLFASFDTQSLLFSQPRSDCHRDPCLAELDGVPQLGQDDQLLHPHHAPAHLLHAGVKHFQHFAAHLMQRLNF